MPAIYVSAGRSPPSRAWQATEISPWNQQLSPEAVIGAQNFVTRCDFCLYAYDGIQHR
jgi:hypothetical protein